MAIYKHKSLCNVKFSPLGHNGHPRARVQVCWERPEGRDEITLSMMHRNSSLWRTCSGKHISSQFPRKILNLLWSWYALNEFRKQISTWALNKATYQNQSVYSFTINNCFSRRASPKLSLRVTWGFQTEHKKTFASSNSIKFLISFQTLFLFLYNCYNCHNMEWRHQKCDHLLSCKLRTLSDLPPNSPV